MASISNVDSEQSETGPTAASSVLGIPELLENILHNLEFQHLFVLQRTTRTFQAVIQDSRCLKQKMFLTNSLPPSSTQPCDYFNPILFLDDRVHGGLRLRRPSPLNRFIIKSVIDGSGAVLDVILKIPPGPVLNPPGPALEVNKHASWRNAKFLLANAFERARVGTYNAFQDFAVLEFEPNATLGEVADEVVEWCHYRRG